MKSRNLSSSILISDLAWAALAMTAALALRYGPALTSLESRSAAVQLPFLAATWVIWALLSVFLGLDGFEGGWRLPAVISQLLLSVGGLMMVELSGGYLFRRYVSRLTLVYFGALLFAGFALIRVVAYLLLRAHSQNGSARRIVILGQGRLVRELRQKFERHPEMLCRVVGILCPEDGRAEAESLPGAQPPISTALPGIEDLLCSEGVEELLVALPGCGSRQLLSLAGRCRQRGIRVSLVPELYELYLSRPHLVDLDGLPVLHLGEPGKPGRRAWKRGFDLVFASILAIFAFPVVLFAALLLRRGRARGFRWEARCGYQGRTFSMLRLNVDRGEAKSFWERLLQELSLTELPQLWNVLRGDMSLVGPRPESPDRVRRYSEWQQQRLTVKPGMTGLAQVHGLREQHSSEEKTRYDLQYVLSVSPWADLSLLLQTLWTLATRPWNRRKAAAADSVMRPMSDLRLNPEFHREMADHAHRP